MKHTPLILTVMITFFIMTQVVGLYLVGESIQTVSEINGTTTISFQNTTIGERPETSTTETLIYMIVGIIVGTALLLMLMKYEKISWWKTWYFLAVMITISISLGVLFPKLFGGLSGEFIQNNLWIVWIAAFILAYLKTNSFNAYIHNFTEVLVYSGIVIFLAPQLSIQIMFILLALISVYDIYAVWKSKHMVKMAKFTSENNLFPGFKLSYKNEEYETEQGTKLKQHKLVHRLTKTKSDVAKKSSSNHSAQHSKSSGIKTSILGGGDVAFPLLFTAVVMLGLIASGELKSVAFFKSMIIVATNALALSFLFVLGKKDKFYPAMSVMTLGCVVGYIGLLLI